MGVPADLGVAVALHGVAFMGGLGKYSEHGHNVGSGALASHAYRMGTQLGSTAAQHAGAVQPASFQTAGSPAFMNGGQQHAVSGLGTRCTVHADHAG